MSVFKNLFWSNVLFEKKINNIKKTKVKDYFLKLFEYKLIFIKFLILIFVLLISAPLTFILRDYWLNNYNPNIVKFNTGMGFSFGDDWPQEAVYFLKILPVIVLFTTFLFTNNILIAISTIIVSLGGFYNLIDKWLVDFPKGAEPEYDAVVDYIQLGTSVANVPDIFITLGTISLSISIFYAIYKINMNSDDEDEDINIENIVDEIIEN